MSYYLLLFLPDKPPIEDLQYFLDFQIARAWAPEQNLQRKEPVCPFLQFSLMGPKLYVSPDQVFFAITVTPLISLICNPYEFMNLKQSSKWFRHVLHFFFKFSVMLNNKRETEKIKVGKEEFEGINSVQERLKTLFLPPLFFFFFFSSFFYYLLFFSPFIYVVPDLTSLLSFWDTLMRAWKIRHQELWSSIAVVL